MYVKTMILKLTVIAPACIQTTGPCQLAQREEIAGPALEVIETYIQTVVQEVTLNTCCKAIGSLPLQLCVTDVTNDNTCYIAVQHTT